MSGDFEAFKQYKSVARWIELTTDSSLRPARDWDKRLGYLSAFCEVRGVDPDVLVKESLSDNGAKNDHLREMKKWVATLPGSDRDRHEAETMLRHFFMKNGMRMLVKPFADVYKRSAV